jgi:hypothetical protein
MFRIKINWDALGVGASIACAIHCAVLPLLFSSLPLFGLDFIQNKFFEYFMIGLAFVIGVYSLSHGFRKHHHRLYPILIFSAGFLFLLGKEINPKLEILFLVIAVTFIISAHYFNYRLCKAATHCHKKDCAH